MSRKQPFFPQRVAAVNSLKCTRLADDCAILATDLGEIHVPLQWWLAHKHDTEIVLVVAGVESAPKHEGATMAKELKR